MAARRDDYAPVPATDEQLCWTDDGAPLSWASLPVSLLPEVTLQNARPRAEPLRCRAPTVAHWRDRTAFQYILDEGVEDYRRLPDRWWPAHAAALDRDHDRVDDAVAALWHAVLGPEWRRVLDLLWQVHQPSPRAHTYSLCLRTVGFVALWLWAHARRRWLELDLARPAFANGYPLHLPRYYLALRRFGDARRGREAVQDDWQALSATLGHRPRRWATELSLASFVYVVLSGTVHVMAWDRLDPPAVPSRRPRRLEQVDQVVTNLAQHGFNRNLGGTLMDRAFHRSCLDPQVLTESFSAWLHHRNKAGPGHKPPSLRMQYVQLHSSLLAYAAQRPDPPRTRGNAGRDGEIPDFFASLWFDPRHPPVVTPDARVPEAEWARHLFWQAKWFLDTRGQTVLTNARVDALDPETKSPPAADATAVPCPELHLQGFGLLLHYSRWVNPERVRVSWAYDTGGAVFLLPPAYQCVWGMASLMDYDVPVLTPGLWQWRGVDWDVWAARHARRWWRVLDVDATARPTSSAYWAHVHHTHLTSTPWVVVAGVPPRHVQALDRQTDRVYRDLAQRLVPRAQVHPADQVIGVCLDPARTVCLVTLAPHARALPHWLTWMRTHVRLDVAHARLHPRVPPEADALETVWGWARDVWRAEWHWSPVEAWAAVVDLTGCTWAEARQAATRHEAQVLHDGARLWARTPRPVKVWLRDRSTTPYGPRPVRYAWPWMAEAPPAVDDELQTYLVTYLLPSYRPHTPARVALGPGRTVRWWQTTAHYTGQALRAYTIPAAASATRCLAERGPVAEACQRLTQLSPASRERLATVRRLVYPSAASSHAVSRLDELLQAPPPSPAVPVAPVASPSSAQEAQEAQEATPPPDPAAARNLWRHLRTT